MPALKSARIEPPDADDMQEVAPLYLASLSLVERLHRRLLDVVKDEFDRRGCDDVNAVQALLLYNIGDSELSASELKAGGYYLGSDVAANLKKLTKDGFLQSRRPEGSRPAALVSLTGKGREVRDIVDELYTKHVGTIEQLGGVNAGDFEAVNASLARLERFWTDQIRFRL